MIANDIIFPNLSQREQINVKEERSKDGPLGNSTSDVQMLIFIITKWCRVVSKLVVSS